MNAKKLVMLLAVVAIAIGAYVMLGGSEECKCCMVPSAGDATVMVMDENCNCADYDEANDCAKVGTPDDEPAMDEPAMEEPAMEEPAMEEPAMEEPATE